MKREKESLRGLGGNIKCTDIHIIGAPGEERERRLKEIFEEIIAENFPNTGKETVKPVQEATSESLRHNKPKEEHIKTHSNQNDKKIKDKDKILKATREKWQIIYKQAPIRLSTDFQTETLGNKKEWHIFFWHIYLKH